MSGESYSDWFTLEKCTFSEVETNASLLYESGADRKDEEEIEQGLEDLQSSMEVLSSVERFRLCCAMAMNEDFFDWNNFKGKIDELRASVTNQDTTDQIDYVEIEIKLAMSGNTESELKDQINVLLNNQAKIDGWNRRIYGDNNAFLILHNLIEFGFESYLKIAKKIINIPNLSFKDLVNLGKIMRGIAGDSLYLYHLKCEELLSAIAIYVSNGRNSEDTSEKVYTDTERGNLPEVNRLIDLYIVANNESQSLINLVRKNKFYPKD